MLRPHLPAMETRTAPCIACGVPTRWKTLCKTGGCKAEFYQCVTCYRLGGVQDKMCELHAPQAVLARRATHVPKSM